MLADRGTKLPDWPAWCYCPLAGAYAVASGGGPNTVDAEGASDIARLGAVAAWRHTRGVYMVDHDLLTALLDTPIERVPPSVLEALPDWCVYVALPGRPAATAGVHPGAGVGPAVSLQRRSRHPPRGDRGETVGHRLRNSGAGHADTGRTVSPHIRRAHWHTYWTGKGRTVPVLRWLHPILVGSIT